MSREQENQPSLAVSEADPKQVLELYQKIQRSHAKLVGPDGNTQSLPMSLHGFLAKLMGDLDEGRSVAIVQNDAQLTTVEAARILGVSRQFLVNLLERDEIPFHMVGDSPENLCTGLAGLQGEAGFQAATGAGRVDARGS